MAMEKRIVVEIEKIRYYTVGHVDDFAVRIGRTIHLEERDIAVFRTSDGRWFALDNKSPHRKGGTLTEGIVSGHDLYDPLYDWKISLETGKVYAPDIGQVRIYPVWIQGSEVQIGLSL
jgi:nitrite reductase (NADH) small subunit